MLYSRREGKRPSRLETSKIHSDSIISRLTILLTFYLLFYDCVWAAEVILSWTGTVDCIFGNCLVENVYNTYFNIQYICIL